MRGPIRAGLGGLVLLLGGCASDPDRGPSVDELDTPFLIASVSKLFTATEVL